MAFGGGSGDWLRGKRNRKKKGLKNRSPKDNGRRRIEGKEKHGVSKERGRLRGRAVGVRSFQENEEKRAKYGKKLSESRLKIVVEQSGSPRNMVPLEGLLKFFIKIDKKKGEKKKKERLKGRHKEKIEGEEMRMESQRLGHEDKHGSIFYLGAGIRRGRHKIVGEGEQPASDTLKQLTGAKPG